MGIIELDKKNNTCTLTSILIFYGSKSNEILANKIADDINYYWNKCQGKVMINRVEYLFICNTIGIHSPNISPTEVVSNTNPLNNYFRIEDNNFMDVSFVDGAGSNTGYFKLKNIIESEKSTTGAHEFGHTMGLLDEVEVNYIGKGRPSIMFPRGSLVDDEYQWNPAGKANDHTNGGTMNPVYRIVSQKNIDELEINKLKFIENKAILGEFTSIYHTNHTIEN